MSRGSFFWALTLTLALHAGAACYFWPRAPALLTEGRIVFVNAVLLPAPALSAGAEIQASLTSSSSTTPASLAPAQIPSSKPRRTTPVGDGPSVYLPFDAVDHPATPLGDWLIVTDALPRYSEVRLILKMWISATGVMDRWEVVDQTIPPDLADMLLADLDKTPIQPAMLNNVAVPSVRQLEVVLSRQ